MASPYVSVKLLGSFQIQVDSGNNSPTAPTLRRKTRALLAYLIATQRPHSRQTLCNLFLPETADPLRALRWQLSQIRSQLYAEVVETDEDNVRFNPQNAWVDWEAFRHTLADTLSGWSVADLQAAVELYRGEFLAGLTLPDAPDFELWLLSERAALRRLVIRGLDVLSERLIAQEEFESAIGYTQQRLQLDPLVESVHVRLIWLFAQTGQREAAFRQYEQCRQILRTELHTEPSTALTDLYRELNMHVVTPTVQVPVAHPPTPDIISRTTQTLPPRHNLPAQTTPFWGRESEVSQLINMLVGDEHRLVTVVGPGGMGKTRLALQVAASLTEQADFFPGGVYLVSLAGVEIRDHLIATIADAIGCQFAGSQPPLDQLVRTLRPLSVLLVLDNFEQLLDEAPLLTNLLQDAPGITLLVTSRVRLNLYEEWSFDLRGLQIPDTLDAVDLAGYSAIQLFAERATRLQRQFSLQDEQDAVVQICRLLGGMPLAIELAACWVRAYSCHKILDEIQQDIDFLSTSMRNLPERHRSMRAAFEHSWRLMPEDERRAFARLSVFRGGFDYEAAEAVADVTPKMLEVLLDASMLFRQSGGRYQIHELLRQFGNEKLSKIRRVSNIHQKHSYYYAAYANQRELHQLTAQEHQALQEVTLEIENVRAGWQWAVTTLSKPEEIDSLANSIADYAGMLNCFFDRKGRFHEGIQMFQEAVSALASLPGSSNLAEADTAHIAVQSTIRVYQAHLYYRLGDFNAVEKIIMPMLTWLHDAPDQHITAEAQWVLAYSYYRLGRYEIAAQHMQESLATYTKLNDWRTRAIPLCGIALLAIERNQLDEARIYLEECLAIFAKSGYTLGRAKILINLASNAYLQSQYEVARRYCESASQLAESIDATQLLANILIQQGRISYQLRDYHDAILNYERSLQLWRKIGDQRWIAANLNRLAEARFEMGQVTEARNDVATALELSQELDIVPDALDGLSVYGAILADIAQTPVEQKTATVILSVVVKHAITRQESRHRCQRVLDQLMTVMTPDAYQRASTLGRQTTLDELYARWLGDT